MKYLNIARSYLILMSIAIIAYVVIYFLCSLIIYSHFILKTNFGFIADVMKMMMGNIAYTSPSFLMVKATSIMASGYIVGKVTDTLKDKYPSYGQAFLIVLITISFFFLIIFFIMIFSRIHYWFFDYLITFISPILFLLGMVCSDKY